MALWGGKLCKNSWSLLKVVGMGARPMADVHTVCMISLMAMDVALSSLAMMVFL